MTQASMDFVEALAPHYAKSDLERALAQQALGVVAALREKRISIAQSWEELFNLDNYEAVRHRGLSPLIKELFEWGMELGDVEQMVPDALEESYAAIQALAFQILETTPALEQVSKKEASPHN